MKPLFLLLLSLLTLGAATTASAQSDANIVYWPSSTLRDYSATLKGRQTANKTMSASEILSDLGNHKFEILRRDGSGTGELHQNWTDVFVVQGGEATILYGGSIEEARDTGNGEIRGPRVVGGKSQKVRPVMCWSCRPAFPIRPSSSPASCFSCSSSRFSGSETAGMSVARSAENAAQNAAQNLAPNLTADGSRSLLRHRLDHALTPSGAPQEIIHLAAGIADRL